MQDFTDAELDAYILARLRSVGVDLSVLPEDDPEAPADRARILESARRFLRSTPPAIRAFSMEGHEVSPVLFAAPSTAWRRGESS
jgi:hypothetical protein